MLAVQSLSVGTLRVALPADTWADGGVTSSRSS